MQEKVEPAPYVHHMDGCFDKVQLAIIFQFPIDVEFGCNIVVHRLDVDCVVIPGYQRAIGILVNGAT